MVKTCGQLRILCNVMTLVGEVIREKVLKALSTGLSKELHLAWVDFEFEEDFSCGR